MDKIIDTKVYLLGHDVDTDQIIPAEHLAISLADPDQRARYGGFALSGVPKAHAGLPQGHVDFTAKGSNKTEYGIIIAGRNFGCGSSREHAPIALAEAGVRAVIARSYARIFYRNAIDGGYFPPYECHEDLFDRFKTGDEVRLDTESAILLHRPSSHVVHLRHLGAAGEIIAAGGLFAYAKKVGFGAVP